MLGDTVRIRGLGSWLGFGVVSGRVRVRIGVRVRVRLRLGVRVTLALYMQKQVSHSFAQPKTVHCPTKSLLL